MARHCHHLVLALALIACGQSESKKSAAPPNPTAGDQEATEAGEPTAATQAAKAPAPERVRDAHGALLPAYASHRLGDATWSFGREIEALVPAPTGDRVAVIAGKHLAIVATGERKVATTIESPCPLQAAAWTQAGQALIGACRDTLDWDGNVVWSWQVASGERELAFRGKRVIRALAVHRQDESEWLLAGDEHGYVIRYPLGQGKPKPDLEISVYPKLAETSSSRAFYTLQLSASGRYALAEGEEGERVIDLAQSKVSELFSGDVDSGGVAWLPGREPIFIASVDGALELRNALTDERLPGSRVPLDIEYGQEPDTIVTGSIEGTAVIVTSGPDVALQTWKVSGDRLQPLAKAELNPARTAIAPDGGSLLYSDLTSSKMFLRPLAQPAPAPGQHMSLVVDIAIAPDGDRIASIDFTGRVLWWDARSGRLLGEYQGTEPSQASLSANLPFVGWRQGGRLLAGHYQATKSVTPATEGPAQAIALDGWDGIAQLVHDGAGRLAATKLRHGTGLALWDLSQDPPKQTWSREVENRGLYGLSPCGLAMARGGQRFAILSRAVKRASVEIVDAKGVSVWSHEYPFGSCRGALSADGTRIAVLADKTAEVYQVGREKPLASYPQPARRLLGSFGDIALSPDGETLAVGWLDTIRVHRVGGDQEPLVVLEDAKGVGWIAFLDDARLLSTESASLVLWRLPTHP